ncbi:MAG: DsbC family protein [Nitrospirae bacterium]|nr:DsbC family protein [Nitrospirota bacterium]
MKKLFVLLVCIAIMPVAALAIDKSEVQKKLGMPVKSIAPTPVHGIHEIVTQDNKVLYMDDSGRYLFAGKLLDMEKRVDLTQLRMDEISTIDFSALPLKDAIVMGNGVVKLAVFSDPDCPYCRKLHKELKDLKNVQIYYYVFNLPMHPKAYEKSKKILCSKDRIASLDKAMAGDELADLTVCETDLVDKYKELASKYGITGTPHMVLENGSPVKGYLPAAELQKKIDELAKKKGKK